MHTVLLTVQMNTLKTLSSDQRKKRILPCQRDHKGQPPFIAAAILTCRPRLFIFPLDAALGQQALRLPAPHESESLKLLMQVHVSEEST